MSSIVKTYGHRLMAPVMITFEMINIRANRQAESKHYAFTVSKVQYCEVIMYNNIIVNSTSTMTIVFAVHRDCTRLLNNSSAAATSQSTFDVTKPAAVEKAESPLKKWECLVAKQLASVPARAASSGPV